MKLFYRLIRLSFICIIFHSLSIFSQSKNYPIVDTGQTSFFDNYTEISNPAPGSVFLGQDAHHKGNSPSYTDNKDGTITDNITGLIWQKDFQILSYEEAIIKVQSFTLSGKSDWRIPTIKEVYSLIDFSGVDVSSRDMSNTPPDAKPFINSTFFDFKYGSNGPRIIDTQMLSSTLYTGKTMGGEKSVFGLNLADGRIKGYPLRDPRRGMDKKFTVRFVSGNINYGKNKFRDNGDGTVSDLATGLMWSKEDSQKGLNWEESLHYIQSLNKKNHLGHKDWRLPNAKELHSIVDYTRSMQSSGSAAINPVFKVSKIKNEEYKTDYPFFWSSTTHKNRKGGHSAVYIAFGNALGFFGHGPGGKKLMDVHGAGAQRSDPKSGDPKMFPKGKGPQGDVIRIYNYVRAVRNI